MLLDPLSSYLERGDITESDVLGRLPKAFLEQLGDRVSVQGILALIDTFGGAYMYVPQKPTQNSMVSRVLSPEDEAALCELHGGSNLRDIPSGTRLRLLIRNRRIIAMREKGMAERVVATRHGISPRMVRRILQRHRKVDVAACEKAG